MSPTMTGGSVTGFPVPETHVLAIASHVVYGYVGNTMAVFVMQSLGCEVAAINTVQFSNHTGYRQVKGTRTSAAEITDLYEGLKSSYLDSFDMMLSGYVPGAAAVEAVGTIAEQLKEKAASRPGSFFWVLDPVMGDNGKLYVAEDVVPVYKSLARNADLILPNQFEAELLSGVNIVDMSSLLEAVQTLHNIYNLPHVVITSINLPTSDSKHQLIVIGSTMTSSKKARPFVVEVPAIDCFFSGTGDMFAALTLVRFREQASLRKGLTESQSWISSDDVAGIDLPLAKAVEKVLATMHDVLGNTKARRDEEIAQMQQQYGTELDDRTRYLKETKATEVRLVRNLDSLKSPRAVYRVREPQLNSTIGHPHIDQHR